MDSFLIILAATLLLALVATGWCLTLIGLPGNWLIVIVTVVYGLLVPAEWRSAIGWPVMLLVAGLAGIGELGEASDRRPWLWSGQLSAACSERSSVCRFLS